MVSQDSVAALIPAKNEAERIAQTIAGIRALPEIGRIVVIDDGSTDSTGEIARRAGAEVITHSRNRGKAAALESGYRYLAEIKDSHSSKGTPPLPMAVLLADADLGDSASACAPLIEPVRSGKADCTIALLPAQKGAGGHGFVTGLGRKYIYQLTGWEARQPLSGQRCLSWEAFSAALPLAAGWGVEVGMSIDLLQAGYRLQEVPCALQHRASANDFAGQVHRGRQYVDVWRAVLPRWWAARRKNS